MTGSDRPSIPHKSSRRRLLLVSMYFAPEPSGNAPYVTDLATHLAKNGWEVVALTGVPHYPAWRMFDQSGSKLRFSEVQGGVQVRRFRHYVPKTQSLWSRLVYEGSFYANVATAPVPASAALLAVVPSLSDAALARPLARKAGCPYGLLFQDIMARGAAESGVPGAHHATSLVRKIECSAVRGARAVGVVAPGFTEYIVQCGISRDRVYHVPNWNLLPPPTRERASIRNAMQWEGKTVVLHAGNMGHKQGLENLVQSMRQARNQAPSTLFVFMGEGNRKSALLGASSGLDNVQFIPPQPPNDYANILAAADILLVHESPGVSGMSLPSKLTSYFAVGFPVVAVVDPAGATAAELERAGAGLIIPPEQPAMLLATINRLRDDPDLARALGERGRRYATEWLSRERGLDVAAQLVELISGGSTPSRARPNEQR